MASTRTITLVVIGVLALAVAALIAFFGGVHNGRDARRSDAVSTSAPPGTASRPASGSPSSAASAPADASPSTTPGSTPGSTAGSTAVAAPTAPGGNSEILPTPSGDSTSGYHLPPVPTVKPAPLLGDTLPSAAVAKGRLVKGFPAALVPPPGARVEASSLSVSDGTLQAALTASGSDPLAVLVHYREQLVVRGYTERATQGVENTPSAAFVKGADSVTVTTVDGRTYLLAHLRPDGH